MPYDERLWNVPEALFRVYAEFAEIVRVSVK